jgi:hypothetical protein
MIESGDFDVAVLSYTLPSDLVQELADRCGSPVRTVPSSPLQIRIESIAESLPMLSPSQSTGLRACCRLSSRFCEADDRGFHLAEPAAPSGRSRRFSAVTTTSGRLRYSIESLGRFRFRPFS